MKSEDVKNISIVGGIAFLLWTLKDNIKNLFGGVTKTTDAIANVADATGTGLSKVITSSTDLVSDIIETPKNYMTAVDKIGYDAGVSFRSGIDSAVSWVKNLFSNVTSSNTPSLTTPKISIASDFSGAMSVPNSYDFSKAMSIPTAKPASLAATGVRQITSTITESLSNKNPAEISKITGTEVIGQNKNDEYIIRKAQEAGIETTGANITQLTTAVNKANSASSKTTTVSPNTSAPGIKTVFVKTPTGGYYANK